MTATASLLSLRYKLRSSLCAVRHQPMDCGRGLGALADPILDPLLVEFQDNRMGGGVVVAENLKKTAVPGPLLLNHHDPVLRLFLGPGASQANRKHSCSSI